MKDRSNIIMILLDIEDSCKFCILDFEDYIENNNKTKYLQLYSNFNEVYFYNSLLIFLHFSLGFHKNYMDKPIN